MMTDFDITELEDWLVELVRDRLGVSANVFTDRPKSLDAQVTDFVVAKVTGNVSDLSAYGRCVVAFHLFAKDAANRKNGKRLSVMYKKLLPGFPVEEGRYIFSGMPVLVGDVADDFGYHARILQIQTIIKNQ